MLTGIDIENWRCNVIRLLERNIGARGTQSDWSLRSARFTDPIARPWNMAPRPQATSKHRGYTRGVHDSFLVQ